jgi:molybdopterin molybdotransferase
LMFTVAEARDRVLDAVGPLETEERNVGEALGYVVADTLVAPHPLPRFDNSAMDGYALRSEDVADASDASPATLRIAGEVRAGDPGEVTVASGTAARIMTGAPVPRGANAVVPVELTDESSGEVVVKAPVATAQHVRPAGDDLAAGAVLVSAGMELGPGELALLSTMGFSPLKVHRRPRVAVVVTGDELVPPEDDPGPGQIRDSNSIALSALVAEAGAEPIAFPPVPDDRVATVDALSKAAEVADLVVSSGGVAVGRYDFVKEVVAELGRIDLWRVAMQPGRPVVLGAIGATPFLGLPGNPVSIHVGFEQFVRPAIRRLRGCETLLRPTLLATLTETVTKTPGRLHFVRVRLAAGNGGWQATPTGPQGSHIQSSLVGCHGVARFGVEESVLEAGSDVTVEVWRLP